METDTIAIIGPQSSVVAHIISHVANELQVPLLSFAATDPTLSNLQFPFFVRTTQSDLFQMRAIAEIVDHYGWKAVVAIFLDDDYGRNGVSALDAALAERRCRISYKLGIPPGPGVNQTDIMDLLVKVALLETRVIVLHVNPDSGFKVFSVARYLGMMGNGYVWIATDWLSSVIDTSSPLPPETVDSMQGVLVLRQHTPDSDRKRAFLSRWNKLTGGSVGLNSYGLYAYDSVWLVAHAIDAFFNQGGVISFSNDSKLRSIEGSHLKLEAMSIFDGGRLLLKNILQSNYVGLTGPIKFNSDRSLISPAYDVINVIGTGVRQIGYWSNYSALSENGDLQRIHDKWLMRTTCSLESAEIDSDRLHLKSFWGLFLICGIACFVALFIYFLQIMRRFRRAAPPDSVSSDQGSSRSRRIQTLLSLMDEKEDHSKSTSKRRKVEGSSSHNGKEDELERNPKKIQTHISIDENISFHQLT
ncbi:hypothetical protein L1049_025830 [Liquidambar formosana]|uniref:Receptor ligand binding region domain-containing protein n=1 Tax=Liquidambar formosana TaxID=63359 RepID=A0AAP0R6W3_LIQFO